MLCFFFLVVSFPCNEGLCRVNGIDIFGASVIVMLTILASFDRDVDHFHNPVIVMETPIDI